MSKQRLKFFNQIPFNEAIRIANSEAPKAKKLSEALKKFKSETREDVEDYLQNITGFSNHKMSAESMDLGDEYNSIVESYGNIFLTNYKKDFTTITQKYEDEIKELYLTYWSKEDTSFIDKVNKLMEQINELGVGKHCLYNIGYNKFTFYEKGWDGERSMKNRALRR